MYQTKANKLKRQFFKECSNGEPEETLQETRQKWNQAKKMCKHNNTQYKDIKNDNEYDLPESSEDSLASLYDSLLDGVLSLKDVIYRRHNVPDDYVLKKFTLD
jgi:hypothetical protein